MNYSEIISKTLLKVQNTIKRRYFKGNHKEIGIGPFGDVQYEIDLLAEEIIIKNIQKEIPDATILSEETGIIQGKNDTLILIDPLDGSLNSVRQIPFFSSTIAIANGPKFSDIIASGAIDIIQGNLYLGNQKSATVDNVRLEPSKRKVLNESIIALDLNIRSESGKKSFRNMENLFLKTKTQRILGSAIMENVFVAEGKIDAFIAPSKQLRTFDVLPAMYIGKKAGLFIKFFNEENDFDILSRERVSYISACTKELGNNILNEINIID